MFPNSGKQSWFVPDAFLPAHSTRGFTSHESACVLNVTNQKALLRFTFFFEERATLGPVELEIEARRTRHIRLDDPHSIGGLVLPRGVPYAYMLESSVPVVLQHSRLDTSAGAYALFTTIAYGE